MWEKTYCRTDRDCNKGIGGIGGVCAPSGNCKFDASKEGKGCDAIQFSDGENPMCSPSYISKKGERNEGKKGQYTACCNCNVENNSCKAPYLEWRDGKLPALNSGNPPDSKLWGKNWDEGSCVIGNVNLKKWAENPCYRSQMAYLSSNGKKGTNPMPTFPFAYDEAVGSMYMTKGYAQYYDPSGVTYGGMACTPKDSNCRAADFSTCTGRDCLITSADCCPGEGRSCGQVNKGIQNWFSNNNPYACSETIGEDGEGLNLSITQTGAPGGISCKSHFSEFPNCKQPGNNKIYPYGKGNYCDTDGDCTGFGSSSDVTGKCVKDMYGLRSCSSSHSGYGKSAGEQIANMTVGSTVFNYFEGAKVCSKQSAQPKQVSAGPGAGYPKTGTPSRSKATPGPPPENFEFSEKQIKEFMKNSQQRVFEQVPDQAVAKCDERDMKDSFLVAPNFAGPGVNLYIITWNDDSRNLGYKFKELKKDFMPYLKKKNDRAYIKILKDDIRGNKALKRLYLTLTSENWMLQFVGNIMTSKFGKNIFQ